MAVPKKRTTSAKQGSRRSHLALSISGLMKDKDGKFVPRRLAKAIKLGVARQGGKR